MLRSLRRLCSPPLASSSTTQVMLQLHGKAVPVDIAKVRDLCECGPCFNAGTKQRTSHRLSAQTRVPKQWSVSDGALLVEWADPGPCGSACTSRTSLGRLQFLADNSEPPRPEVPWEAATVSFPDVEFDELFEEEGVRRWLRLLQSTGFAVVRGVPARKDVTEAVGALIGVPDHREMFGERWEVAVEAGSGNDSAYSSDEIFAHTDGCYLRQQPDLQLFHCFQADQGGGGRTGLVDGFRVAREIQSNWPDSFDALCSHKVQFQFEDGNHRLLAWHTVLGVCSQTGALERVTWNNLDRAVMPTSPRLAEALRIWDRVLYDDPRWEIQFSLAPGDLLLVNNRRVMHARHGPLTEGSRRLLYGFYMNGDGVSGGINKPRVLRKR